MFNISQAVYNDHRELEVYYNEIVNNVGNHKHQERFGHLFMWELARHSAGEELIIHPAFEQHLGARGREMAQRARTEHRDIMEHLKVFHGMKATDDDYVGKLNEIWSTLARHMGDEEEGDMPALESRLQAMPGESESMAKRFGWTKVLIPSRSRNAVVHPPFATVLDLLTAPIDKIAEILRHFPDPESCPHLPTR